MRSVYRYQNRRIVRDTIGGVILMAISGLLMTAMVAGAAYCDFDDRAVKGECLQNIYDLVMDQ